SWQEPRTVAYSSYANTDGCRYQATVRFVTGDGSPMTTSLAGLGSYDGNAVDDLWWGRDGSLYATLSSWSCSGGSRTTIVGKSLWRLDGTTWVSVGIEEIEAVRQLTAQMRAVQ